MALKKNYFLVYPSLKVQIFIFVFFVRAEHHCSRGKGVDETVKFGRNSCPPILAMKKLEVIPLVSSIEYFDHLLVKNYAGKGFEKSLFFSLSQLKSANIIAQAQFFIA